VPLDDKRNVRDPKRIEASIPTIKYILEKGAQSVVLISHLGRPKSANDPKASLKPVVPVLEKLLKTKVTFVNNCVGQEAEAVTRNPPKGSVILLENLRYNPAEKGDDIEDEEDKKKPLPSQDEIQLFRKQLSQHGDVFVNDAFGTAHRAHSSMVGINLPVKAAGFLLKTELQAFAKVLENPPRPFVAILGGAKVKDKIQLISNLLDKVDEMIIGGAMAFTFLHVLHGTKIGKTLYDKEGAKIVPEIMKKAEAKKVKIHLPLDFRVADKFHKDAKVYDADLKSGVPEEWYGLDSGPKTIAKQVEVIFRSKAVIFNGPQGVFEFPGFSTGTLALLEACAAVTKLGGAVTIVGGGDSAAAASRFGFSKMLSHVSTGGGAALELLEGKQLPGIVALSGKVQSKL
jgi:phosphoglycerate kinase